MDNIFFSLTFFILFAQIVFQVLNDMKRECNFDLDLDF